MGASRSKLSSHVQKAEEILNSVPHRPSIDQMNNAPISPVSLPSPQFLRQATPDRLCLQVQVVSVAKTSKLEANSATQPPDLSSMNGVSSPRNNRRCSFQAGRTLGSEALDRRTMIAAFDALSHQDRYRMEHSSAPTMHDYKVRSPTVGITTPRRFEQNGFNGTNTSVEDANRAALYFQSEPNSLRKGQPLTCQTK